MPLTLRSDSSCQYDIMSLGELMIRLSPPGHGRIEFANTLEVHAGGGEFNVSYALARFGLRTGLLSKIPDNPVGRIGLNHGRAVGMDMSHVILEKYDGVGKKNRMGLNFTEVGTGVRASVTLYDRGNSACAGMTPTDIDWEKVFSAKGSRWLHTGGIMAALSPSTADVVRVSTAAAHKAGTIVSYDLNFRSKLWTSEQAIATTKGLIDNVSVLIGNEEDFQKVLGFEVEGADDENLQTLKVDNYKRMVEQVVKTYPHIKAVCTTLREVQSGLLNNWSGILWYDGEFYESRKYENLEIEDRVGGGDGFSSGVAYGFLTGMDPQDIVNFGAAHGALLQSTRGDTSNLYLDEVIHVMKGGSARIKR